MARSYGCIPDDKDDRDHRFKLSWLHPARYLPLPKAVDLRRWCPPVMDQGQLGSCTAHGVTAALRYNRINTGLEDVPLSRLQLYYDARVLEGNAEADVGAQIRDVIKVAAQHGVGRESLWPYDVSKWAVKPSVAVDEDAVNFEAVEYERVPPVDAELRTVLWTGRPVVIGVKLFSSFERDEVAANGNVPMPSWGESEVGNHCMLLVGYEPGADIVMNSWGEEWGDKGFCRLPPGYIEKYGSDCWAIFSNK